jgi:spore maturation protein CgeB
MTYPRYADRIDEWYEAVASAAPQDVAIIALPAGPRERLITFPELDRKWKNRDPALLSCYDAIRRDCLDADVFFCYGAGIHPEFLAYLPTFNCYFFCDDPEDSPWQSSKVVPSFDAAYYANIASRFQYESWGCKRHSWLPIFTAPSDVPCVTELDEVLNFNRTESVVFVGGFDDYSSYRRLRLERLSAAFPLGTFRGRGWPAGKIEGSLRNLYLQSRIGFNLHRTTGPINRRMFQLPAHGVMQICDNKTGLGQIFELGKEVEGFDTIDEAIELTKYYLDHDQERAAIAEAGYQRFWKDYHAGAVWARLRDQLLEWGVKPGERKSGVKQKLPSRNAAYFFGVAREKIQTETDRMIRSAKAAKREYLRKDPWWKIYERVFTSEAVYLPDYGDTSPADPASGLSPSMAGEESPPHVVRARQGAIRWAMTQLAGKAVRIGISDSQPDALVEYLSVDPKRQIQVLGCEEHKSVSPFDLLICVPTSLHTEKLVDSIREWARIAPRAVYGFPLGESPTTQSGEVYWLLKSFYANVSVFHMPNPVVPWLEPVKDRNSSASLIALAEKS